MKITKLLDDDTKKYFDGDEEAKATLMEALDIVKALSLKLQQLRDADMRMVQDAIPLLQKAANWVSIDPLDSLETKKAKMKFLLNRQAGQNVWIWNEFIFGVLISSQGEEDLHRLNPYVSSESISSMLSLVTISMLRANRLGHVNRCIGATIGLDTLLTKVLGLDHMRRSLEGGALVPKLIQSGEDLSKNITMARHYMTCRTNGRYSFDPRYD